MQSISGGDEGRNITTWGRYVLLLATLSGVAGISYEILYARMLSTYFGDIFYITAAILVGFLVSIGIGALVAHRYVRYLPYVEIAIGLYGLLAAYVFSEKAFLLVESVTSVTAVATPAALVVTVLVLLAIPAALIGFSIPLFTIYLTYHRPKPDDSAGFRHTYLLYNLGAAAAIILIEFMLIHTYGITASVISVACINFLIGIALLRVPPPQVHAAASSFDEETKKNTPGSKYLVALFIASAASGVFQLFFLKVTHNIFGPLNENFAIVIATVFIGMALGAYLAQRWMIRFATTLLVAAVVTIVTFLITEPIIHLWAFLQSDVITSANVSALAKVAILSGWGVIAFTSFGALIPLLLRERPGDYVITPGRVLAVSAFGNAAGFVGMIFFFHERLSEPEIIMLIAVLFLISASVFLFDLPARLFYRSWTSVLAVAILLPLLWPGVLVYAGYERLQSQEVVALIKDSEVEVTRYRSDSDASYVLQFDDGTKWVTYNGNSSLRVNADQKDPILLLLTIDGIAGSLFSKEHNKALVLGLGVGVTAGATATMYETTRIVDINATLPAVAAHFAEKNFNVTEQTGTEVVIRDGIIELTSTEAEYDLIVTAIASSAYHSANKLRSREVYEQIKERLAPGGVYASWFSSRLGEQGIRSMIRTLEESFADCRYLALMPGALSFVCGNETLEPSLISQEAWPSVVVERMAEHGITDVSAFLYDIVASGSVSPDLMDAPLNTLDHPFLEFSDTLSRQRVDGSAREALIAFVSEDLDRDPFSGERLSEAAFARRCMHTNIFLDALGLPLDTYSSACNR